MQLPQYADSWSVKMTAPTIEGVHSTVYTAACKEFLNLKEAGNVWED